jgi:hypothetical protein
MNIEQKHEEALGTITKKKWEGRVKKDY